MGVESLIANELRELGAEDVRAENARVLFSGDEHILARANICLRHAERIQILLGSFHAVTFPFFAYKKGSHYDRLSYHFLH